MAPAPGPRRSSSRRRWAVLVAAGASATALLGTTPVRAGAPSASGKVVERNVSSTGDWHAGEPEMAVNPRDPANVVMVWPEEDATGIYRNPATGTFDTATGTLGYANDPAFSRCGLGVSTDGGQSWERSVLPAQTAQSTLCSDAAVSSGPDGTFYATVITFHQPTNPLPGVPPGTLPWVSTYQPDQGSADVVVSSTDGGRTWTWPPVDAIGNRGADARRYAAGSSPEAGGEGTSDRPWIVVDQSSGTVYVTAMSDAIQFNGTLKTETWVTSSTDHARSFGTVYPIDSAQYPQSDGPAGVTAADGVLALAYVGTVGSNGASMIIFETSRDHGRTFTRHVVAAAPPRGTSLLYGINLAADPARPGSYALSVPTGGETGMLVYATTNSGSTWTRPATVGVGTDRPWLAFAPSGHVVGIMGRDTHGDGSQDVLVAFSRDGGATFGAPVRANSAPAPAPPPGTIGLYDDTSYLTLTGSYGYVAWGDWRKTPADPNGERNVWMARIPLSP